MRKKLSRLLTEAKKDLDLAIVKCLSQAPLRPAELSELLAISESDLIRDHDLDLYMVEQVKQHTKREQFRLRAQNQYTPSDETENLYPDRPYTRTSPVNESSNALDSPPRDALKNIVRDAHRLHEVLNNEDNLPRWCKYKIAQSQVMMNSIREYIEHKIKN